MEKDGVEKIIRRSSQVGIKRKTKAFAPREHLVNNFTVGPLERTDVHISPEPGVCEGDRPPSRSSDRRNIVSMASQMRTAATGSPMKVALLMDNHGAQKS